MEMAGIDIKTIFGVLVCTALLIEVLKVLIYGKIKGIEKWLAALLPMAIAAVSKAQGNFAREGWLELMIVSLIAGVFTGVMHDKLGISRGRKALVSFGKRILGMKGGRK